MSPEDKAGKTCKRCGAVVKIRTADAGTIDDPNARTAPYAVCACDSIAGPDVD